MRGGISGWIYGGVPGKMPEETFAEITRKISAAFPKGILKLCFEVHVK